MITYDKFEEVENDIKDKTPSIIYKYRTWEDNWHKKIITDREVWFAHPHTLNDPFDVRPPLNYIVGKVDWDKVKTKLMIAGRQLNLNLTRAELETEVEKRLQDMKEDPIAYYTNSNKNYILDSNNYDNIGVFSCCSSFDNEPMWAHYGNNHCGFSVGFNTIELSKTLDKCVFDFVEYNDTPIDYHILGDVENSDSYVSNLFRKSTKWKVEEELRFIAIGIDVINKRAEVFPVNAVEEIIFGINTSQKTQDEIIKQATLSLPNIPFYKLETKSSSYGFDKVKL